VPQRTNEFQHLVSLIQKALAPKGAKITDSALVDVPGMKDPREIDVLIETDVGPYQIKIAVEAKDEGRKLDSTKFEAIIGKYLGEGGVKVNMIVVITHRGFYQPVIERAQTLGIIKLLTLNQAESTDWAKLYPQNIQFRIEPYICKIQITPAIDSALLNDVLKEGHVFSSHGTDFGTPEQFAKLMVSRELFQELAQKATESGGQCFATITVNPTPDHIVRFRGSDYPLKEMMFSIHCVDDTAPMKYKKFQLIAPSGDTTDLTFAEVTVGGKKLQLVMPEGMKSKKIVLHVDSAEPKAADSPRTKKKRTRGKKSKKKTKRKNAS